MSAYRLENEGYIDRSLPLNFKVDGKKYQGFKGDTLASALLANDVILHGRSFKYHRPRGILSAGPEEPNALYTVGKSGLCEPNSRATMVALYEGLYARSQNRFPSLKLDFMAINTLLSPFLSAGFYYKTFLLPAKWWLIPEWFIRRAAGLGRLNKGIDKNTYAHHYAFCDIAIVGAGPAGISAALAAARSGAKVVLIDDRLRMGGQLLWRSDVIDNKPGRDWLKDSLSELESLENVTLLSRTSAIGHYDENMLALVQHHGSEGEDLGPHKPKQRLWHLRAKKVIYASGAIERPLLFGNNDTPGVMLAGAGGSYLGEYGVAVGQKVVIATNNDSAYKVAYMLAKAGVGISALLDERAQAPIEWRIKLKGVGVDVQTDAHIKSVQGGQKVKKIMSNRGEIEADAVLTSGGWAPAVHLHSQAGGTLAWHDKIAGFVPKAYEQKAETIGAAQGDFALVDCLRHGFTVGKASAQALDFNANCGPAPNTADEDGETSRTFILVKGEFVGKCFVDFQNDVTNKDISQAALENYSSVEHLKRYTTLGMATDQGKTSNITGLALLAQERHEPIEQVGTTTFRPPYVPVTLGALAGPHVREAFQPIRRTPIHDWHAQNNASFIEAGLWMRPQWYTKAREGKPENMWESIKREACAVRKNVGLADVSTLGKIDIQGPDALTFIERLYCNSMKTLKAGKVRYGLMLREDGFVFDDGTLACLSEQQHYHMTTTTVNAARVLAQMEYYLDVVWPELAVRVTSVTDQWAAMSLAGPNARKVLERAVIGDVSDAALPFMGLIEAYIDNISVRIFRITFSGELGFEINCPAHYGSRVWQALMKAGEPLGITPYGLEALGALRLEKGHVVAAELDGRTTPEDLGLGKMVSKKKDFIGRLGLKRIGFKEAKRPKLVGLKPADGLSTIAAGSQLCAQGVLNDRKTNKGITPQIGWISSAHYSVAMDQPIALGFIEGGLKLWEGQTVFAANPLDGKVIPVVPCSAHMFDPKNERVYG